MTRTFLCVFLLTAAISLGCRKSATVEPVVDQQPATHPAQVTALSELSETQQQQRDSAVAAKEKLFQSLLGELTASIGKNGVAESIEVCKAKAPELAKSVSAEMNLTIRRTSFQLRNDQGVPPEWATTFVSDRAEKEVNVDLGEDRLGVLLPIRLKAACIKCHGKSEALDPSVIDALATHYPNDKATGFAEGDLRGYFWVEVPSQAP